MKKSIITVSLIASAGLLFAATPQKNNQVRVSDPEAVARAAKERAAQMAAAEGGLLERKGQSKGRVVFIDTQDLAPKSVVVGAVQNLDRLILKYDVRVEKLPRAKPLELMAKTGATVAVIIVNDEDTPGLLSAPDEHWAMVNVRKLQENLNSDAARQKFFALRCSKQIQRALVAACGGMNSSYKGNIMAVTNVPDMDLCPNLLPVDRVSAVREYMKALGMKPRRFAYYSMACEEGWAPKPTNDVQKAIWDKVHELPTKPIKILPETKPVKD